MIHLVVCSSPTDDEFGDGPRYALVSAVPGTTSGRVETSREFHEAFQKDWSYHLKEAQAEAKAEAKKQKRRYEGADWNDMEGRMHTSCWLMIWIDDIIKVRL